MELAEDPANWALSPDPIVSIGGEVDTVETFGRVVGAFRTAPGEIVVADAQSNSLRYFDITGRFLRSVGRTGEGPGEFRRLYDLDACRDSLFAMDLGQRRRYNVYSANGEFVRAFELETPQPGRSSPYHSACGSSEVFVSYGWEASNDIRPGYYRPMVPYWLSDAAGRVLTSLGEHPGAERFGYVSPTSGRLGGSRPHPLGKSPALAVGRSQVYVGTADSFAIAVYSLDGKLMRTIYKPRVKLTATEADIDRGRMTEVALREASIPPSRRTPGTRAAEERAYDAIPPLPTIPAYRALLVDRNDHLWVQSYPRAGHETSRWIVFSPAGKEVGRVDLPLDLEVYEVGDDYVLGRLPVPPDGADHVIMYALLKNKR